MENIILATFEVESEAYMALSEMKKDPIGVNSVISQAVIIKRNGNNLESFESFDTGVETSDNTTEGGLIGGLIGILGGPIGMLLGGSIGILTGASIDADDALNNASIIGKVAEKIEDGTVAIIALAQETDTMVIDSKLSKYKVAIERYDAAHIHQEVEEADALHKKMQKEAQKAMRHEKTDEFKRKIEEKREKIKEKFEKIKSK